MNSTQQSALSSLVAGCASAAVYYFLFADSHDLTAMFLLLGSVFFLALASTLWIIGKLDDRIGQLEQKLAEFESRFGNET